MVQRNRSAGYKARTEPDSKELLEAGTTQRGGRGQRKPINRLERRHGTANVGPKRSSQHETSGRLCGTLDGAYS